EIAASLQTIDRSLEIAEALDLPETISQALNTKSLALTARGRAQEAFALLKHALLVAIEHDLPIAATRAYINLSHHANERMALDDALEYQTSGIALARRVGIRWAEWWLLGHLSHTHERLGEWHLVARVVQESRGPGEG